MTHYTHFSLEVNTTNTRSERRNAMGWKYTDLPHMLHTMPAELKSTILRTLDQHEGNVSTACEQLGVTRVQLYNYMRRLSTCTKNHVFSNSPRLIMKVDTRIRECPVCGSPAVGEGMKAELAGIKDKWSKGRRPAQRRTFSSNEFLAAVSATPDIARQMLLWAYEDAKGDEAAAARALGITRPRLYAAARVLGVTRTDVAASATS
jgi:DNA-binding NtrC family response regulator